MAQQPVVCVVPKQNVEILARALHALSKIGEELYVEPVETGLTFRTVHANHSVYAEVHFMEGFFSFYKNPANSKNSASSANEEEEKLHCRITMKSCLAAFRSLACIRRHVDTCFLQIEPTWLTIKFRCHHSYVRSLRLPVIECESLQAFYTEDEVPNKLKIGPSTFASVIKNFQFSEKDITLAVDSEKAVLKNFVANGADPKGVVRSQLKLEKGEFLSFEVAGDTAITFCLKAFRAVLFFSEQADYPLTIKFSEPGDPVIVINSAPVYELRLVLSSLAPEDGDASRAHSQQMLTPLRTAVPNRKRANLNSGSERRADSCTFSERTTPERGIEEIGEAGPSSSAKRSKDDPLPGSSGRVVALKATVNDVSQTDSEATTTGALVGTARPASQPGGRRPTGSYSEQPPPLSGLRWGPGDTDGGQPLSSLVVPESDEEDTAADDANKNAEPEECVPGTPPPPHVKKSRLYFQRCFEPTMYSIPMPDDTVLAEDSD